MRSIVALLVLCVAAAVGAPSVVRADCAEEARELRAHLTREADHAEAWNTAWAVGFAAAAFGQMALVSLELDPLGSYDRAFEEQMYVGAAKASLGAAVRIVRPLRFTVPASTGAPCADAATLRAAITKAGRRERASVLLTLIGGTLVNLAGSALLWHRHDLKTAAQSFVTGAIVGPISAWTQPRGSWRMWRARRVQWNVGVGVGSVWLGGRF